MVENQPEKLDSFAQLDVLLTVPLCHEWTTWRSSQISDFCADDFESFFVAFSILAETIVARSPEARKNVSLL
jgi:hypothetical protein